MSQPYLAEIKMFAGNFAPRLFALCNGQLLAIAQNSALFSLLGTTYGGDGRVTYGLPNMQGRSPIHWGQGADGLQPVELGEMAGAESVTLNSLQMPIHNHQVMISGSVKTVSATADKRTPTGNYPGSSPTQMYSDGIPDGTFAANSLVANATCATSGGSQPFGIRSPYLAVSFIIATQGIFPSRN